MLLCQQPLFKRFRVVIQFGQLIPVMETQPRNIVNLSVITDKVCTRQNPRERIDGCKYLRSRNGFNPLHEILTQHSLCAVRDFPGNRVREVGCVGRIVVARGDYRDSSPCAHCPFPNFRSADTIHSRTYIGNNSRSSNQSVIGRLSRRMLSVLMNFNLP